MPINLLSIDELSATFAALRDLGAVHVLRASEVNHQWRELLRSNHVWRHLCIKRWPSVRSLPMQTEWYAFWQKRVTGKYFTVATQVARWRRFREDHHLLVDFTKDGTANSMVLSLSNSERGHEFQVAWSVPEFAINGNEDAPHPHLTLTSVQLWRASTNEFCSLGPFDDDGEVHSQEFGEFGGGDQLWDYLSLPLLPRRCEQYEIGDVGNHGGLGTGPGNTNTVCYRVRCDEQGEFRQDSLFGASVELRLSANCDPTHGEDPENVILDSTGQRTETCARPLLELTVDAEKLESINGVQHGYHAANHLQGTTAHGLSSLVAMMPWY